MGHFAPVVLLLTHNDEYLHKYLVYAELEMKVAELRAGLLVRTSKSFRRLSFQLRCQESGTDLFSFTLLHDTLTIYVLIQLFFYVKGFINFNPRYIKL